MCDIDQTKEETKNTKEMKRKKRGGILPVAGAMTEKKWVLWMEIQDLTLAVSKPIVTSSKPLLLILLSSNSIAVKFGSFGLLATVKAAR